MNITEKVKSYEDACEVKGVDPVENLPYKEPVNTDQKAINAFAKITTIIQVLNEGWQPDWNNDDEYKYYPWFDMETYPDQVGSGVGFSFGGYGCGGSASGVGSRLVFRTRALAEYAGKQFLDIYRAYMVIE